jgi:hypothetical protein
MNQRESSGLPLRAMVMVLLFLGVVFLLVGFQAMGSDDDSGGDDSPVASTITSSAPAKAESKPAAPRPQVRVVNVSSVEGAAEGTATRLRDAGWDVSGTGNLSLEGVASTTVYYTDAPGEREAADEIGKLLEAPVEPRSPALAEEPPGLVVAVTG